MTNKNINSLTAATLPLAGTETIPVWDGATKKVAVDDLTVKNIRSNATSGILQIAGPAAASTRVVTVPNANWTAARTDAAQSFTGDQTLATGNLVQGTAAKGINFTANTPAAGMTSQLLNWYEQGTFTPSIIGTTAAGIGTYGNRTGRYTRIGNRVLFNLRMTWTAHTGTGNMNVDGLPFTILNASDLGGVSIYADAITLTAANIITARLENGSTQIVLRQTPTGTIALAAIPIDTAGTLAISGQYEV